MSDQYTAAELAGIRQALDCLVAVAHDPSEPQSSVQLEQAAKPGQPPRVTVKVYASASAEAAAKAVALYDDLVARYAASTAGDS